MEARSLEEIGRAHGVVLLLQFGSTVSGRRQHPRSDVDLAVLLHSPSPSLTTLSELSSDLRPFYPGREIDLAVINRADPFFLKKITEAVSKVKY